MTRSPAIPAPDATRDILLTRIFDAPRKLVWDAMTKPEQMARWYGPKGFSARVENHELKAGAPWTIIMIGPDGAEYPSKGVYLEVSPMDRIISTDEFGDDFEMDGTELPDGMSVVMDFEDAPGTSGERTRLTIRIIHPTTEDRRKHREMGVVGGWDSSFLCLDEFLAEQQGRQPSQTKGMLTVATPSETEVVLRRPFHAPKELVFKAFSTADNLRRWWGCDKLKVSECTVDFRVGGSYRVTMADTDGTTYTCFGEYKEIVQDERIVQTFVFDDPEAREHPALETITFEQYGDICVLNNHIAYDSQATRDAHLGSGMEHGVTSSFDKLDAVLAGWKA
ncbi:MAG: SRPBCC domain-containing protein [Phycisphaerales bacterium JB064]